MASGLLAAGDPAVGSYNGFTFSTALFAESIVGEPVYDSSRRTIIYVKWTITLTDVIYAVPPATIDAAIRDACMRLESPGGALSLVTNAFRTDFSINTAGGKKDVMWGPSPGPLQVEKLGNNYAAKIKWTVEVHIPECTNAKFEDAPVELCFRWMIDKDQAGYTTRRVIGHLVIAQTRPTQGNRKLRFTADKYREQLRPFVPPGFRPGPDSVVLSEDKCRLDFTFSDTQLQSANIPPPNCVFAKANLKWRNEETLNFMKHIGVLTAEYQMAPGHSAGESLALWRALWQDRILTAADEMTKQGLWPPTGSSKKPQCVPLTYSAEISDWYGPPKAAYSLTFMTVSEQRVMLTAGLWKPLVGSNWQLWSRSLADTAFSPRGQAGMKFDPKDDAIVDLCNGTVDNSLKGTHVNVLNDNNPLGFVNTIGNVDPISSWLDYSCAIQILEEHANAIHKPIPQSSKLVGNRPLPSGGDSQFNSLKTPAALGGTNPFAGGANNAQPSFAPGTAAGTPQDTIPQILNTPTYFAVLTGQALRAGFAIQAPMLVTVGGAVAIPMNDPGQGDGFVSALVGNCGVAIYGAKWQLRYLLTSPPDDVVAPPHPYFSPQGGDSTVNVLAQPGNAQPPPKQTIDDTVRPDL